MIYLDVLLLCNLTKIINNSDHNYDSIQGIAEVDMPYKIKTICIISCKIRLKRLSKIS